MVAYSPNLTRIFACHINVKLCILRVRGIEYLLKYVCKTHDGVAVDIFGESGTQQRDEIKHFRDVQYRIVHPGNVYRVADKET